MDGNGQQGQSAGALAAVGSGTIMYAVGVSGAALSAPASFQGGIVLAGDMRLAGTSGATFSVPVPFQGKIVLAEDLRIAGTTHIHGIDAIAVRLDIGTELRLQREPGNVADAWAIKVFAGEDRIGYVPADCNEMLALLMDGGKALSAKLTSKEKRGSWNKLYMEVSLDD